MPFRLRVDNVSSASQLPKSLSPGEADTYGAFDGDVLTVSDLETAELLARHHNVERLDDASEEADPATEAKTKALVNVGECPWCDDYEGDHVAQHASSAHPDEWADYSE